MRLPSSFWNDWLDPGTVGDHALAPLKGNGPELIDPADPNTAGERSETK